jgi:hypothetical protein
MGALFARFPKPKVRPFLVELFTAWGCRVEPGRGKIEVYLTRPLQRRFEKRKLTLLLSRPPDPAAAEGELMVPGNPMYRSVLDLACEKGGLGRGFARAPKRRRVPSTAARAVGRAVKLEGGEFRVVAREEVFHPIVLLHFNISYGVPEVPDEIRSIGWDVLAGEATDPGPFAPGCVSLDPEPEPGFDVVETGDLEAVFAGAIAALQRDISRKVRRTEAKAKRQLDKEGARIENFYRRMIQEEKSRRRSRQDGDTELSEKIELYQLDWKRKLTEATERLKPRIGVRLFCIEQAFLPRRRSLLIVPDSGVSERECFYDYITGNVVGPACDVCGRRSLQPALCQNGHLCCSECVAKCKLCGEPFCHQCWVESWGGRRGRKGPEPGPADAAGMDPRCAREQQGRRRVH